MHQKLSATWAGLRRWGSAHAAFLRTAGVWIGAFVIYAATTARGVLPADSGEFQLVAWGWGIAHPPGYPLYTIATALWTHLVPLGPALLRINLFSAALAATTVALCGRTVVLWARSTGASQAKAEIGGLVSALALGLAATFWAQATTANIRMPTMLFTACGYLALARYRAAQDQTSRQSRRQGRALIGLGLVVGLGIGHHPSLAFVAIGWALYLVLLTPRLAVQPRRWLPVLVVAAAGWALPQLYLPLRSSMENVPLNPSDLTTWSGFWDHVLARGFGGDMFAFATAQDLAQRLPLLPTLFRMQFPPLILLAMVLGWLWLFIKDHHIGLSLLASWLIQTFVTITYRAPQTVEYLMPAYIPMALILGLALALLPDGKEGRGPAARLWQPVSRAIPLLSLLILGLQAPGHIRDFALLAKDRSVWERIEPLLHTVPEDALILADWRWATPLWVLQAVEGLAPEVEVAYVYPEAGRAYEEVWRARAEQASPRPLLTTHRYDWPAWTWAPVGGGYRLYPRPLMELPGDLGFTQLEADLGPVRLLGYRWEGDLAPGRTVELQLAWQHTSSEDGAVSFATRLWSTAEAVLSAADQQLESDLDVGEVRFATLTHQLPIDHCSDQVTPTISVYTLVDGGFEELGAFSLPTLDASCRYPKLPTERPWPGIALPGGPFLRGVDYDTRSDGSATAYVHWCGPGQPLQIRTGEAQVTVAALALGECQTVRMPETNDVLSAGALSRPGGGAVHLLALPLPDPKVGERYLPFGDEMVLIDDQLSSPDPASDSAILTLKWRTTSPIVADYAVSARFQDANGQWLGVHDMQPGLGAVPTLKWVTRGDLIRDPHPVSGLSQLPDRYELVVYERFRLTPLRSSAGTGAVYELR